MEHFAKVELHHNSQQSSGLGSHERPLTCMSDTLVIAIFAEASRARARARE